jgi:two-component sensor histidine kinase
MNYDKSDVQEIYGEMAPPNSLPPRGPSPVWWLTGPQPTARRGFEPKARPARGRVISVAAVQNHLHAAGQIGSIEMATYLSRLCEALAESMISENRPILLKVDVAGRHVHSKQAVSIGLLVTERVINALKHAFPVATKAGRVVVAYEEAGTNWKLSISDNGIGVPEANAGRLGHKRAGLGTSIVKALGAAAGGPGRRRERSHRHDRLDHSRDLCGR